MNKVLRNDLRDTIFLYGRNTIFSFEFVSLLALLVYSWRVAYPILKRLSKPYYWPIKLPYHVITVGNALWVLDLLIQLFIDVFNLQIYHWVLFPQSTFQQFIAFILRLWLIKNSNEYSRYNQKNPSLSRYEKIKKANFISHITQRAAGKDLLFT